MGTSATKTKQRWNSANYTQVKAYVAPGLASTFKAACSAAGTSMNSELSKFMTKYCQMQPNYTPTRETELFSTKAKRRKMHEKLLREFILLRDAQAHANDNVPENFRETDGFDEAEEIVSKMDDAIDILEGIY